MEFNPLSILGSMIGALTVAGLLAWVRRPRLVVLVPKTFSYSEITDRGQLVEITVFNRSFKTEESIDLTLNPRMSYSMLGANSQDVSVEKNRVRIVRIAPSDEVTALLIVENGDFRPDDIIQTVSKETKGKTVSRLEEVSPTGPQRVMLLFWIVAFPTMMYAGYLALDKILTRPAVETTAQKNEKEKAPKVGNWTIDPIYAAVDGKLLHDFQSGRIAVVIGTPSGKGDITTIPFRFSNSTAQTVTASLTASTNESAKRIPSYQLTSSNIHIVPGGTEERTAKVIVPTKSANLSDRSVFIEVYLQSIDGDTLKIRQEYLAGG
jgi:hypothetical protein